MRTSATLESVGALLRESAIEHGARTALVFGTRSYTFAELDDASSRLAAGLQARGFGAGDTFSLYAPNGPEWLIAYYAVMKLGGIANPLNLMLTPEEAAYAMNDCGAVAVFGSADRIAGLARVRAELAAAHRLLQRLRDGGEHLVAASLG